MPSFSTRREVAHLPENMFDLVADVEHYPQFVPLCSALKVKRRVDGGEGVAILVADMTVAYKFIRETFTSRVTMDRPNLTILVEYLEGPFSHLENRWTFTPAGEQGAMVGFSIDYDFRSRTLALLMGAMFDTAFRKFADAFEKRANEIYKDKPLLEGADRP